MKARAFVVTAASFGVAAATFACNGQLAPASDETASASCDAGAPRQGDAGRPATKPRGPTPPAPPPNGYPYEQPPTTSTSFDKSNWPLRVYDAGMFQGTELCKPGCTLGVTGTVVDGNGAPRAAATVTSEGFGGNVRATTGADGTFRLRIPGAYCWDLGWGEEDFIRVYVTPEGGSASTLIQVQQTCPYDAGTVVVP